VGNNVETTSGIILKKIFTKTRIRSAYYTVCYETLPSLPTLWNAFTSSRPPSDERVRKTQISDLGVPIISVYPLLMPCQDICFKKSLIYLVLNQIGKDCFFLFMSIVPDRLSEHFGQHCRCFDM
jgi:hypothetical protein